ncbi:MAG: phage antirepressor N-terminal domain-containing protein [Gilliamella sp.]|uniref:phage antirepressor N-terminal domain-containing protein n=1 Tax=Gilliamella sp. TaxID=1891236 RepID=UPI00262F5015|nr:phage antirepressor N-terminal domain-containing protein [Gilliamella sp.]MCO6551526.1 phage antirepressor N-terminal domain-containing protein [Gilliamella sp.]
MSNTKLETIQFHNQQLIVLNHKNKPYIAMKPVCENIGLDWHAQRQRIHRHHVLSKGEVIITSPSKSGNQEYLCLPISMINGWLFGIETSRVKPGIRATLEQYQLECFDVLYNHFMPKVAQPYTNTIPVTPNRELLPKGVYHNKSLNKPYRAYVYDMGLKKEVSVGTFATVDEALDAQKDYFQTKPFKTAPIPAHGRWLVISDINGIEVKNIDGYNCVNFKQFRKLQSDARTYAEETIKLLHKIQDLASLSHEFLYRLKVLEGVENASRLDTPILDLLKN